MTHNIRVSVGASRKNTATSDQSHTSQESPSLESYPSSDTSPLQYPATDDRIPFRNKPQPRPTVRAQSGARSIRSVRVESDDEESEEEGDNISPGADLPPAPEPPGARHQQPVAIVRERLEERDTELQERRPRPKEHHHHHHHKKRRSRRIEHPAPSQTSTEEMERQGGYDEYGRWVDAPGQHHPPPHNYMQQQQHYPPAPPSQHPGMGQPNMSLVQAHGGYPQQQMYPPTNYGPQGFYSPPLPQSPGMMGMNPFFSPWSMMMQQQQPAPSASPQPGPSAAERELQEIRDRERRAFEEQERRKHELEMQEHLARIEKARMEDQAKAVERAKAEAIEAYRLAEEEKAAQKKALEDAKDEIKKAVTKSEKEKAEKKEEEHKKKLAEADEAKKKAEAEAKEAKAAADKAKGPPEKEQKVCIELCAPNTSMKPKRFNIPFNFSKSWKTLSPMLLQACEADDKIGDLLADEFEAGHFDIIDSEGNTVLKSYWDDIVKPDQEFKVLVKVPVRPASSRAVKVVDVGGKSSKHGKVRTVGAEPRRSKSGKAKNRESKLFGEVPGLVPPPPPPGPAPMVPEGITSVEMMDDDSNGSIVMVEERGKGPGGGGKKKEKVPGVMDVLFGRRRKK